MPEEQVTVADHATPEYVNQKMNEPGKVPLVLFSGGLDSTTALLNELKNTSVDVLYIAGAQGPHKINAELQAFHDILEEIKTLSGANKVRCVYKTRIEINTRNNGYQHDNVLGQMFQQPPQWLTGMMAIARPERHSSIVLSYVTGDQMASHISDLVYAWNYLCTFVFKGYAAIELQFPLRYHKKRDLINQMPLSILAKTWTCELPEWADGDFTAQEPGIEHRVIPSLVEFTPDRSYKYLACGKCHACLAQKESYVTSQYGSHEKMMALYKASQNPGEFVKIGGEVEKDLKAEVNA